MATKDKLDLNPDQTKILQMAMEFYVRLGLGQFSDIATRFNLIHGHRLSQEKLDQIRRLCTELEDVVWDGEEPWKIEDKETSLHTLVAFELDSMMQDNANGVRYARERIKGKKDEKIF